MRNFPPHRVILVFVRPKADYAAVIAGDLGRRRPDGNVECIGRADNQVKIRGFRIELGEVDKYLSSHPLIRENVTLLRRDAFEEPTLGSYLVPELSQWSHWIQERANDKGHIVPHHDESMVAMLKVRKV